MYVLTQALAPGYTWLRTECKMSDNNAFFCNQTIKPASKRYKMESVAERDLINRIRSGEPGAFSGLLRQHQHTVYSLIVQMVSSREDAEELTQDVFVKAYQKIGSFRGESAIATWLYRIAYNTAISAVRKKKPMFTVLDEKTMYDVPDEVVDEVLNRDHDENMLQSIQQAIAQLHPDEKALISLYYTQGRTLKEVASIMNLSGGNAKIKLFRIRKKIVRIIRQTQNGPR